MTVNGVNHVAIIASNLEKSKNFYITKLGLKPIFELDRPDKKSTIVYLNAGNIIIELFSFPNPPKRLSWPEACGLRHLAFTVDDVEATVTTPKGRGIESEPIRIDSRTGKKMTFIKDPDDLPIEITESRS
mgnify:CR=1 FL=1